MHPMSSMQSSLLPGVTPGWNDPPSISVSSSGGRLYRHRRVVDPSISGNGGGTAYSGGGMYAGQPQGSIPGVHSAQPGYGTQSPQGYGMPSAIPQEYAGPQQFQTMSPYGTQTVASFAGPTPTFGGPSGYGNGPPVSNGASQPAIYAAFNAHQSSSVGGMSPAQEKQDETNQQAWAIAQSHNSPHPTQHYAPPPTAARPPSAPSIGSEDSHLIFEPPNTVTGGGTIPGQPPTVPNPATYRPPTKAPGDVNLPEESLVAFLVKAAFKLSSAKCQGVQIKLHSLQQQFQSGNSSAEFVKSLNYVVDALDSEKYDDAHSFFDHLLASFPQFTQSAWVAGVKLLLSELRRPSSRVGSAGRH